MIFNYISFPIFFISLAIGIFFVYVIGPESKPIYIYPSPENIDKVLFKDDANNCFKYEQKEVMCPKDSSELANTPVQQN
jgi:hypothetical protein